MHNNRQVYVVAGALTGLSVVIFLVYQYIKDNCNNSADLKTSRDEIETDYRLIPHDACGMVIGKYRQNIMEIEHTSKAKIRVSREAMNPHLQHRVAITGTREQIEKAWAMISEKVLYAERKRQEASLSILNKSVMSRLGLHERFVEVVVSAMESPSHFWIQVLGKQSLELDNLSQQMTRYYAEPNNHVQSIVMVDDLVAAPRVEDDKWYRAKVMEVTENGNELTLFYLDYGYTAKIAKSDVSALDGQFRRMEFQAIKCRLENTIPESGEWTDAAKEFFSNLCQVGQWKTLKVKIMNLYELEFKNLVLAVELYDVENGEKISISEKLVKKGFARFSY